MDGGAAAMALPLGEGGSPGVLLFVKEPRVQMLSAPRKRVCAPPLCSAAAGFTWRINSDPGRCNPLAGAVWITGRIAAAFPLV